MIKAADRAARHGHFGPDDIDRRGRTKAVRLGHGGKAGGAGGGFRIRKGHGSPAHPIEVSRCSLLKPAAA